MPSRRMRLNCLALAQGAKKALKRVNGVLLKPQRGAFGKSVRRKLKSGVFRGQEALFPEVSLPKARRCHRVPCFAQPTQRSQRRMIGNKTFLWTGAISGPILCLNTMFCARWASASAAKCPRWSLPEGMTTAGN